MAGMPVEESWVRRCPHCVDLPARSRPSIAMRAPRGTGARRVERAEDMFDARLSRTGLSVARLQGNGGGGVTSPTLKDNVVMT